MSCQTCALLEKKDLLNVYEDEKLMVILPEKPAAHGHLQVILKKHFSLKELSQDDMQHLFWTASYAASSVFEYLGVQGTNIIFSNGIKGYEHLLIDVVPRTFDDGLDFQWVPKELPEAETAAAFDKLKDRAFYIGKGVGKGNLVEKEEKEVHAEEKKPEVKAEDNYRIRHLIRIP